ncbi:MAG TPA: penicillin acylase family protein [Ignavibacteria bacterium]
MNKNKIILIGSFFSIIVIIVISLFFLYKLLMKSLPQNEGSIALEGVKSEITIYRNDYGIPQIIADNEYDLFFSYGYVSAQDRLWQMDILRRTGEGRLSEVFGMKTIEIDALIKAIGINRTANKIVNSLSPQSRNILQAYSDGINAFIKRNQKKLPLEFDFLKYEPEQWKPEHSIIILRLFSLLMHSSFINKIIEHNVIEKVGVQRSNELLNTNYQNFITIHNKDFFYKLFNIYQDICHYTGFYSNYENYSFVVSNFKSKNRSPILASNLYSLSTTPSIWYEISLHSNKFDVSGLGIPGIPAILVGNNGFSSWSISNLYNDNCNFIIEQIDSIGLNKYKHDNNWLNLKINTEKIYLNDYSSVDFSIFETAEGPIISNFEEPKISIEYKNKNKHDMESTPLKGEHISFKWVGNEVSDDLLGFYLLLNSKTIIEQEDALKHVKVPALNFCLCDKNNIGVKTTGFIYQKSSLSDITLEGSSNVPISTINDLSNSPITINPPNGYLLSTKTDFSQYVSNQFYSSERLKSLIEQKNELSFEDIQNIQNDIYSPTAKLILHYIMNILEKNLNVEYFNQIYTYFKNWDCTMDKSSISATLYNTFIFYLYKNTLEDELGPELSLEYTKNPTTNIENTLLNITKKNNIWFDNINTTQKVETMEEIYVTSLKDAIQYLKNLFGSEPKNWIWGELHKIYYNHYFGEIKELQPIFNIGPFNLNGKSLIINYDKIYNNSQFYQEISLAAKYICDMSYPQNTYLVISTGISGQPLSPFYSNQVKILLENKLIPISINPSIIKNSSFKKLIISPKN